MWLAICCFPSRTRSFRSSGLKIESSGKTAQNAKKKKEIKLLIFKTQLVLYLLVPCTLSKQCAAAEKKSLGMVHLCFGWNINFTARLTFFQLIPRQKVYTNSFLVNWQFISSPRSQFLAQHNVLASQVSIRNTGESFVCIAFLLLLGYSVKVGGRGRAAGMNCNCRRDGWRNSSVLFSKR